MSEEVIDLLADFEDLARECLGFCDAVDVNPSSEMLDIIERWFIVNEDATDLVDEDEEDETELKIWHKDEDGNVIYLGKDVKDMLYRPKQTDDS